MKSKTLISLFASLSVSAVSSFAVDIVAHRGASHDAPENTVASFKLGYAQKADADELDIWLTKDERIIVSHDENVKRVTGVDKKIKDQTLKELRELDAGSWKDPQWKGEKLPTLEEALATIPDGKRLFIEIKCGTEVLPELESVIKASGKKPQQMPIIAFSYKVASEAKAKLPQHEVSFLYDWKKDKDSKAVFTPDDLIAKAKAAKLDGIDVEYKGPIDAEFVKKAKAAGLKVYVWTCDDAEAAKRLVAAGVDGITTNRPQWLRQELGLKAGK